MKKDRELLEYAAKAAGISMDSDDNGDPVRIEWFRGHLRNEYPWNPLADDGDALWLAVTLNMMEEGSKPFLELMWRLSTEVGADEYDSVRRAIVRAAAAIGENME